MRVTVSGELEVLLKNRAARLGVQPATAARAALRYGVGRIGLEDAEAEMTPAQARERERKRRAKEARDALGRMADRH